MSFRHLVLAGVIAGTTVALAGCNNSPQEHPWQLTNSGNDVLLHNGQTGDVFAIVDGNLMEIDKVRLSDLGTHTMTAKAMPSGTVNFDITTVYREGRAIIKIVAEPLPEANDYSALAELETVYDGDHESVRDLVLELHDSQGMILTNLELSDFQITRIRGVNGEVEQITFWEDQRMAATTYELIDRANVLWYNR